VVPVRVLGVDPGLDGVAARRTDRPDDFAVALGESEHPLDQVDSVDRLGDRMLHLQPGVDLQERRLLTGRVIDVLDGSGGAVADGGTERGGRFGEPGPDGVGEAGRRGLLQHLLVAPLQRAVAVAQGDHASGPVAEHLHLDMAGLFHQPFQEQTGPREAGRRDPPDAVPGFGKVGGFVAGPHADAAATAGGLEHHRIAEGVRGGQGRREVRKQAGPGKQRNPGGLGGGTGGVLGAEHLQLLGRRADEHQSGVLDAPGELRVLGQESVTGVDRPRTALQRRLQDQVGAEIAVLGGRRPEPDGVVREPDVRCAAVRVGEDGDRAQAEAAGGADDADRDLAAVGDQQGVEGATGHLRALRR
jgi:hypothetical protein